MSKKFSSDTERRLAPSILSSAVSNTALPINLEQMVAEVRPHLLEIARLQGVAPDSLDDVVQETLLEAWRHLDHFQAPWHFEAWLNGICRNVCRRYAQVQIKETQRQVPLPQPCLSDFGEDSSFRITDIPDPFAPDPLEELYQQDLVYLLERALGHVSLQAREALQMYYLAELPQREVAARIGISLHALEMRLQRARRELRYILNNTLRADAESFGLLLEAEIASGWRTTREWCCHCGRNRLTGVFEQLSEGRVNLRMRCPVCSPQLGDMINTEGLFPLGGLHTFRPALKRLYHILRQFYTEALANNGRQRCLICKNWMSVTSLDCVIHDLPQRYKLFYNCPHCHLIPIRILKVYIDKMREAG
jgi:RNA polymerase sigma factor (sigma-70 family)